MRKILILSLTAFFILYAYEFFKPTTRWDNVLIENRIEKGLGFIEFTDQQNQNIILHYDFQKPFKEQPTHPIQAQKILGKSLPFIGGQLLEITYFDHNQKRHRWEEDPLHFFLRAIVLILIPCFFLFYLYFTKRSTSLDETLKKAAAKEQEKRLKQQSLAPDWFETHLQWNKTGDGEFPYKTSFKNYTLEIRVNDFPEYPTVFTLLVSNGQTLDFDDWPHAWTGK